MSKYNRTRTDTAATKFDNRVRNWGPYYELPPDDMGDMSVYKQTLRISDVVTPNYHKKVAAGAIINNPCFMYVWTSTSTGSSYIHFSYDTNPDAWFSYTGGSNTRMYGGASHLSAIAKPKVQSILESAKSAALSDVDSTPYAFGEDIGEVRQTLKFVKNPLSSLAGLAKSFQRDVGKYVGRNKGKDRTTAIADVYTSYQFAFKPLVRSAFDACEAYTAPNPRLPIRKTAHGNKSASGQNSTSDYNVGGNVFNINREIETDLHASLLYWVSNPISDMQWKLGLRARDFPSTLWQLMPYSFMVDRVINVTSFIEGMTALLDPNVEILAGSLRTKETARDSVQLIDKISPGWTTTVNCDVYEEKRFIYDRQPWIPSVLDSIPNSDVGNLVNTATKIADLGALIVQRLR